MGKKIIVINLGSTSTKVALFENDRCRYNENIKHSAEMLNSFGEIFDQYDYRYDEIVKFLASKGLAFADMDCIVSRGGHTEPLAGGPYKINQKMLDQSKSKKYGNHPADLGLQIAGSVAKKYGIPAFTVDSPVTDEFEPLARYSGMPEIQRVSAFQVLNHRACAKRHAEIIEKDYGELNLIVVMLGGGISVAAHKKGRMIDGNNALFGDGPFSTNRTGTLPVGDLVDMCFSGKYTYQEMKRKINGSGGLVGYTGLNDLRQIEEKAKTEDYVEEVFQAMCYQVSKEIGAAATVLFGEVDGVLMTGGMANSKKLTGAIMKRVGFIAPVYVYPGEFEMETLGKTGYNVLTGKESAREL
jgi:butyrate kinase